VKSSKSLIAFPFICDLYCQDCFLHVSSTTTVSYEIISGHISAWSAIFGAILSITVCKMAVQLDDQAKMQPPVNL
jgi:hypothetical protein